MRVPSSAFLFVLMSMLCSIGDEHADYIVALHRGAGSGPMVA